jgi:hypothetical protein
MSIAQLEQEIAALKASLGALESAKNAALQEIRRLGEEKAELRAASQRQLAGGDTAGHAALRSQEARLDEVIGEAYSGPAFKNLEAAESKIRSLESQLYQAQQKAKFESDKATPVVASPAPVPPPDTGNATSPPPTAPGTSPPAAPPKAAPDPPSQGVAASGPQGPSNTSPGANTSGNLNADGAIEPQPNILDRFASYTYSASVYLMSTRQYTRLLRSKKKNINGYNLLFQSGGAPINVGGPMGKEAVQKMVDAELPAADYGRNPAFPQDFYIDSITIDNALPGRQTQAAHMVTNLKFTVIEPGNISLIDRLYAAVQDMGQTAGENQPINYTATAYLMVLRWYGYDANGNLVKVGALDPATGLTDPNAVVEKFIPFIIKKINWSVGSKLVSYEFECAPINQMVAGGTRRGTVPYDVQLTATSVGELLGGNVAYSSGNAPASAPGQSTTQPVNNQSSGYFNSSSTPTASTQSVNNQSSGYYNSAAAPAKANAAADKKIIKLGLMGAMNEFQQRLVTEDIYRKADTYEIVFVPGRDGKQNIRDAQIRLPGAIVEQTQTGMGTPASKNAAQAISPSTNALNISSRNWSVKAGMQVVQAIDLAIRNSSYIYSQALTTYAEQEGIETLNSDRTKPLQWFKINMEAEQGDYDTRRNDYAYKIRFIISEYEVPNFDSKYFPVSKFRGVHKSYPFWFTGQNTAVLDFQANFNGLYNITVTGTTPNDSAAAKMREKFTASMREIPKYTYMAASSESRMGSAEKGNEIASNASEVLYSPGDMANTKVRIIGDPSWIQQGDLAGGVSVTDFSYSPFFPDGTINFDANQVLFEISWQRPQDYNIATGLADPYKGAGLEARLPLQSTVYQATKVISEFRQGRFEQTLEGTMYFFPIPSKTNTVAASTAAAENNALAAAGAAYRENAATTGGRDGNATAATTAQRPTAPNISAAIAAAGGATGRIDALPDAVSSQITAATGTSLLATGASLLATGAKLAPGLPLPNVSSASAPFPTALGFPIGPLLPALPPISNGVVVGPAANDAVTQTINNATRGYAGAKTVSAPVAPGRVNQSYNLYSPQRGARDN